MSDSELNRRVAAEGDMVVGRALADVFRPKSVKVGEHRDAIQDNPAHAVSSNGMV